MADKKTHTQHDNSPPSTPEMGLITDLGTVWDAVQALGHPDDSEVLSFVLSKTWPFPDGQDRDDMSGVDCALVVLRHVLAQFPVIDSDMYQRLSHDAVFCLCTKDFSGETPEKLEKMHKERVQAFKTIGGVMGTAPTFRSVITSCAIWREFTCSPYQPVLSQEPGSEQWVLASDQVYYRPPSIRFKTAEHRTIQHAIDASFGIHQDPKSGVKSAMFGACPCFLSILYRPNTERDPNFGIDSVAEVWLPRHTPKTVEDGVIFEEAGSTRYRLIAVVRTHTMKHVGHEYVRIYDIDGNNILPLGDKSRYDGIIDDNWSLADQDRCYMLFYVRLDRPVPEGGPPRMEEVHHEEHAQTSENNGETAVVAQVDAADAEQPGGEDSDADHAGKTETNPKTPSKLAPPQVAPDT